MPTREADGFRARAVELDNYGPQQADVDQHSVPPTSDVRAKRAHGLDPLDRTLGWQASPEAFAPKAVVPERRPLTLVRYGVVTQGPFGRSFVRSI